MSWHSAEVDLLNVIRSYFFTASCSIDIITIHESVYDFDKHKLNISTLIYEYFLTNLC